jgi:hypothetical protein
LFNK